MAMPEHAPEVGIDGEQVVGTAADDGEFLESAIGDEVADDERLHERVHRLLRIIELEFPEELEVFDAVLVDVAFRLLPTGALRVATMGEPIDLSRGGLRTCEPRRGANEETGD